VIRAGENALETAFKPVSPAGVPLEGNLNLYTGPEARAAAEATPGYLVRSTIYYGPADAAEQALRAQLGLPEPARLPPELYTPIWDKASRNAVVDATLSRNGVNTLNDPFNLSPSSIQARVELPWLRGLGLLSGGLSMASGGLTIAAATDPELPPPLVPVAVIGGSLEATGGLAYAVGALGADGAMMTAGATVAETGGIAAIPLLMWANVKLGIENQRAIQPTINKMIEEKNYVGAALLSMPMTTF